MTDNEQGRKPCPPGRIRRGDSCVMPEVTFTTFIMSLNTSALFHLGELEDPVSGEKSQDLVLAKHAIDTLQLLQNKTRGNVTDKERELLENVLHDLKLRYVKASE